MKYCIVIDMQNDFITGSLANKEAMAILPKVKAAIESFDGTVIFTRDTHKENYLDTQEGKKLPVPHCIQNTWGWEVEKTLTERIIPLYIDKPSFGSLLLGDYFKQKNDIESITLIGVCTDICVISNAMILKAALPEVEIIVDAALCAGVTPESHNTALQAMKACQITVCNFS